MGGFFSAGELLDEGFRLYRRHAVALLRFTFAPALIMTLMMCVLLWYGVLRSGARGDLAAVVLGGIVCFPVLTFLSTGVLHATTVMAADQPLTAGSMATAAFRRLLRALGIGAITILPAQVFGVAVAGVAFRLLSDVMDTFRQLLYRMDTQRTFLVFETLRSGLQLVETLSYYAIMVLALQLPSALVLYLLQHTISRLPRPTKVPWRVVVKTLWLPVVAALLTGTLVLNLMALLAGLVSVVSGSSELIIVSLASLIMIMLWTLSPLQPIWMSLLYRRNRGAAQGEDLTERVRVWQAQPALTIDEPQMQE
ncbi:MAG: hypothetical protein OHK0022_06270 [Roseiflexaceae bacterium]